MAITSNTYTGNGSNKLFSITFPYLETTDVDVYLNGVLQTVTTQYTFANATTIEFVAAPGNGVTVILQRSTNKEDLNSTFFPGSSIKAADLNENFDQLLYISQENTDVVNNLPTTVTMLRWKKTATAGQTVLTGNDDNAISLVYTAGFEQVYLNGAHLTRNADYTASDGATITMSVALLVGDLVEVMAYAPTSIVGTNSTGINFTQSGTGAVTRNVDSKLKDVVSVKDFGAVGDGTTNDTAAIQAASAATSEIYFPVGTYLINTSISISASAVFADGAALKPASGQTVTLAKAIKAGRHKIIDTSLGGLIAVTRKESVGYPEWFGAIIDSSANAAVNLAAIQATLSTFSECNLAGGDYFISNTLEIKSSFKSLQGQSFGIGGNSTNGQTRLVVTSATADCISVYTTGLPSDPSTWIGFIKISDLQVARNAAPLVAATTKNSGAGIRARSVSWLQANRVFAGDHIIGFFATQTVRTYFNDCNAIRTSNSGQANDTSIGFWLDGSSRISGFVSGNASIYLNDCGLTHDSGLNVLNDSLATVSIGLYCEGTASDLFLNDFEVSRAKQGIIFNMVGFTGDTNLKGMQDVHLRNFILDNVTANGIVLQNFTSASHIARLDGGYIQLAANTAGASPIGIYEIDSLGQVTATDIQIIGRCANSTGIYVSSANNSYYRDSTIIDCEKPFVQLGGRHITLENSFVNTSGFPATQAAITATNASRCIYSPTIDGDSAVFPKGVQFLGAPQNLLEVNTTNILSTVVSGGASNILYWKGAAVTGSNNGVLTNGGDNLLHTGFIA